MNSWTNQKRAEKRQRELQEDVAREEEQARRANRSWYEKIEECEDIHDVKEVLHELIERLDL